MEGVSYVELSSVECTYIVLLESIFFFVLYIKEYGPTLPSELVLYLKYLQPELNEFIKTSFGKSKTDKLISFLSLLPSIFHVTDSCSLRQSADKSVSEIFKKAVISRAAALAKKGAVKVSEIVEKLNKSVILAVEDEELHNYLSKHESFDVVPNGTVKLKRPFYIELNCKHYHYVLNFFFDFLKKERVKYEDVLNLGEQFSKDGPLFVLCALYRNKHMFTCQNGEISLTAKSRNQILNLELWTFPAETLQVHGKRISFLVNKLYGSELNGWMGRIGYLEAKFGFVKVLVDLQSKSPRYFEVYFFRDALQTLCCFDDLRSMLRINDVVAFDAIFDCNSVHSDKEKGYWRAVSVRFKQKCNCKPCFANSDSESSKKQSGVCSDEVPNVCELAVNGKQNHEDEPHCDKEKKRFEDLMNMYLKPENETQSCSDEVSAVSIPFNTSQDSNSYPDDDNNETRLRSDLSVKNNEISKNHRSDNNSDVNESCSKSCPSYNNDTSETRSKSRPSDKNVDTSETHSCSGSICAKPIPCEGLNSYSRDKNRSNETQFSSGLTYDVPVMHSNRFHTALNSPLETNERVSFECDDSAANLKGNTITLCPFATKSGSGNANVMQKLLIYESTKPDTSLLLSEKNIHKYNASRQKINGNNCNEFNSSVHVGGGSTGDQEVIRQPKHLYDQSSVDESVGNEKCMELFYSLFPDLQSCEDISFQDQIGNDFEAGHKMKVIVNKHESTDCKEFSGYSCQDVTKDAAEGSCKILEASNCAEVDLLNTSLAISPKKQECNAQEKTEANKSFCPGVETEVHLAAEVLNISSASSKTPCESLSQEQVKTFDFSNCVLDEVKGSSIFDNFIIRSGSAIEYSQNISLETSLNNFDEDIEQGREADSASDITLYSCVMCPRERETAETQNCNLADGDLICSTSDYFKQLNATVQLSENLELKNDEENLKSNTVTLNVRDENSNKEKLEFPVGSGKVSRANGICMNCVNVPAEMNGKFGEEVIAEFGCGATVCGHYQSSPVGHEETTQLGVETVPFKNICADDIHCDSADDSLKVCCSVDIVSERDSQTKHKNILTCLPSDNEDIYCTKEAEDIKVSLSESYPGELEVAVKTQICHDAQSECISASEYSLTQSGVEIHNSNDHVVNISDNVELDLTCAPDHHSGDLELKPSKNVEAVKSTVSDNSPELFEINGTVTKLNDYLNVSSQEHAKVDDCNMAHTSNIICNLGDSTVEYKIQLFTENRLEPGLCFTNEPSKKPCPLFCESACRFDDFREACSSAGALGSSHQNNASDMLPSEESDNYLVAQIKEHSVPFVSALIDHLSPEGNSNDPLSSSNMADVGSQDHKVVSHQDLNDGGIQGKRCLFHEPQVKYNINTKLEGHCILDTCGFDGSCCIVQELRDACKQESCVCYSSMENSSLHLSNVQCNSSSADLDIDKTNTKLSSLWINLHSNKEFLFIFSEIVLMDEHNGVSLGHHGSKSVRLYFVQEAYKECPHLAYAFNSLCVGNIVLSFVPYFVEESDLLLPTFVTLVDAGELKGLGYYENLCPEEYFKNIINYSLKICPKLELHHDSFIDFNFSVLKYGKPVPQSLFKKFLRWKTVKKSAIIRGSMKSKFEDECTLIESCNAFSKLLPSGPLENGNCCIPVILCDNSQDVNTSAMGNTANLSACQCSLSPQISVSPSSYVSCQTSEDGTVDEVDDDFLSCASVADDLNDLASFKDVPSSTATGLKALLTEGLYYRSQSEPVISCREIDSSLVTSASMSLSNEEVAVTSLKKGISFNSIVHNGTELDVSSSTSSKAICVKDVGHNFSPKEHGFCDSLRSNSSRDFKLETSHRLIYPFKAKCRRSGFGNTRKPGSASTSKNCNLSFASSIPEHIVLAKVIAITDTGILLQSECETAPFVCNFPLSSKKDVDMKEVVQVNGKARMHIGLSRISTAFPHILCLELSSV